jgi:hypothetical protein
MSHAVDWLIGSMTHLNPYNHLSPTYGANQFLQPYGGMPYFPPPTYQQSYPVVPYQPLGVPPLVPQMHPVSQSSTGPPPTPAYNPSNNGSASTSCTPYGSSPQKNPYFPFPGRPQLVVPQPRQPHASVNFVQPSPIQQDHTFEQLNMKNLSHQPNNAKKKWKNRNNNNPEPLGNNPQQNYHVGDKQNQGN